MNILLRFFATSVLLSVGLSCSSPKHEDGRSLIAKRFDLINRHQTDSLAMLYTANAYLESPNFDGIKNGPAGIREAYSRYFTSTPDLHYTVTEVVPADSIVVATYTWGGTLQTPENGTPAYMRGKKYVLKGCTIFTVREGKISREASYFDQVVFLRQVGFFNQKP